MKLVIGMKVRVIGSGSMWSERNSACYLIDNDIMVDFPNGACKYLYKAGVIPTSIRHILITHFHADHYFDLPFYILAKSKSDKYLVNIYCSSDGRRKIRKLGKLAFAKSYSRACKKLSFMYNFDNNFFVHEYKVFKLLVDHVFKPAYGYIFKNGDVYVGFTGDTSLCNPSEYMAEKCNYLFCDCSLVTGSTKHQGVDNIKYLSKKYPDCKFIVSHMSDGVPEELSKLKLKNVIIPKDGDVIDID